MTISDQIRAFREVIFALFHYHDSLARKAGYVYSSAIETQFPVLSKSIWKTEELESLLPDEASRLKGKLSPRVLRLPRPDHGPKTEPCLDISFNFGCNIPEISLRIGLLLEKNDEVYGYGFRLDSPHGKHQEDGIHHYYHLQMIKKLAGVEFPSVDRLTCISDSEPSFPIDAKNCVQMIFCLIAGLYGLAWTNQFVRGIDDPLVKSVYGEMRLTEPKDDLRWFWRLTSTTGGFVYYETDQEEKKFFEYAKPLHQNHEFAAITPEQYRDVPNGKNKLNYLRK